MTDVIKLDYELADEMVATFLQSVEQLQDTMQEMQHIANMLEEGALLGRGGVAFTDALRTKLAPAISRLTDKYEELAEDVRIAKQRMIEADKKAASLY